MRRGRNPRRAYEKDGTELAPMTLANMRSMGVRSVDAQCSTCGHEARGINVDRLPDDLPVPDVGLRFRCSQCGGKDIETRPDWSEHKAFGMAEYPGKGGG